jgi:hypothetical protein
MNGTKITTSTSGACFVEEHHNTAIRYFNGRKYAVQTHHDFYQYIKPGIVAEVGRVFSVYFRFVTVRPNSKRVGSVYKSISPVRPTNLMRAINAMVPDDIQVVPF